MSLDDQIKAMLGGENGSAGTYWNFSKPGNDNFMPSITGTVVKISASQERNWNPATRKFEGYKFWDDGNAKLMYVLHIRDDNGSEWLHEIKPKSMAMMEDWLPQCPGRNLVGLLGMEIKVDAEQPVVNPNTGEAIPFSSAMRRHFKVAVIGQGKYASEGVDSESFRKVMERKRGQQQPVPQQPVPQHPVQQRQNTPMDPRLQASLQAAAAAGAANMVQQQWPGATVQQVPAPQVAPGVQPPVDIYDQDIPF